MENILYKSNSPLQGAILGGGPGSLIGETHRLAISFDSRVRITAGVFSRDRTKNEAMAVELGIDPKRCYSDVKALIEGELSRSDHDRIDWVSVLTPNLYHYDQISSLIKAGFHVVSEKPLTTSLPQAFDLHSLIRQSDRFFGLTHTYTGYAMIKEARMRVTAGELGKIHKVVIQYAQGWLMDVPVNKDEDRPWRTLRAKSGNSCTVADVGTHAAHLVRYVTGLEIKRLLAMTNTAVPWNELEDDANVLLEFSNGAKGVLIASQSSTGERNKIILQVYGENGSIEWSHDRPQILLLRKRNGSMSELEAGSSGLLTLATGITRLPAGHPEGFIEAFANHYRESFRAIRALKAGENSVPVDVPGIDDGIFGMQFITQVIKSAENDSAWIEWNNIEGEKN